MTKSRTAWGWSTIAGVMLGVSYAASPAAVWFVAVASALVVWACHGLEGRERRVVMTVVLAALAMRALAIALFFLLTNHTSEPYGVLIGDERFIQWRAMWLRNIALGIPIAPSDWINTYGEYGETALIYAIAYLHLLIGPSPYGAHLVNTLLFVIGAIVLYKTVRHSYGPVPAFVTLCLLQVVPSMFIWSISAMKESAYFCFAAMSLGSVLAAVRAPRWWQRILGVGAAIGSVWLVGTYGALDGL